MPIRNEPTIKDDNAVAAMRRAGAVASAALDAMRVGATDGVTTRELAAVGERMIHESGCRPVFLGYGGFPAPVCVSVNEEILHGVPGDTELAAGDLVKLDIGVGLDGWCVDTAISFVVGRDLVPGAGPGPRGKERALHPLIDGTWAVMHAGIRAARAGVSLRDVARAMETTASAWHLCLSNEFCGHGIGRELHEFPAVPNVSSGMTGDYVLVPGVTICIEPICFVGEAAPRFSERGFTILAPAVGAHFEHTVLVTEGDPVILTCGADR